MSVNKGANILTSTSIVDEQNIGFNGDVDGTVFAGIDGSVDNSIEYADNSTNDNSIRYSDSSTNDNSISYADNSDNSINYADNSTNDNSLSYVDNSDNSDRSNNSISYSDNSTATTTNNYTVTDFNAVDRSFDFADNALENVQTFASRAFGGLTDAYDQSLGALSGAVSKVADANRSETAASFDKLVKYGLIAVAVIGVAIVITRKGAN